MHLIFYNDTSLKFVISFKWTIPCIMRTVAVCGFDSCSGKMYQNNFLSFALVTRQTVALSSSIHHAMLRKCGKRGTECCNTRCPVDAIPSASVMSVIKREVLKKPYTISFFTVPVEIVGKFLSMSPYTLEGLYKPSVKF